MSKRFAVAVLNFYDPQVKLEIIHAEHWLTALMKHSEIAKFPNFTVEIPSELKEAKEFMSEAMELAIDVIEIP